MSSLRPTVSVSNTELYERWAKVYDTDGNILQAIDDYLIPSLLSKAFSLLSSDSPITATELGCGTGRNTVKLLDLSNRQNVLQTSPRDPRSQSKTSSQDQQRGGEQKSLNDIRIAHIFALDLSPGMLHLAKDRCSAILNISTSEDDTNMIPELPSPISPLAHSSRRSFFGLRSQQPSTFTPPTPQTPHISFFEFDALEPSLSTNSQLRSQASLVLSTLVLEHLPIAVFFSTVKSFLRLGGVLVVTNMHAEMGNRSQAGFLDPETGEKIQGSSYVYEIEEVLEEGKRYGFELIGNMEERGVSEEDIGEGRLLGPRGRKWIRCKVWFGCVMRLQS